MIGAYVGDCIGSEFEFPIGKHRNPDAAFFGPKARFTDDSVCSAAIAQWLVSGDKDPTEHLHQFCGIHLARGFGGKFLEWVGSERPVPYGSWGNGSAMRASPCALWAKTDEMALELAARASAPTHGHPDAVNGAQAAVMATRWAMEGLSIEQVIERVEARFGYTGIASMNPETLRATHKFDVSCAGTVPLALACLNKGQSFEGALRLCISMGGDADTLGTIAGPVAEALWGIPAPFFDQACKLSNQGDGVLESIFAIYGHPSVRAGSMAAASARLCSEPKTNQSALPWAKRFATRKTRQSLPRSPGHPSRPIPSTLW